MRSVFDELNRMPDEKQLRSLIETNCIQLRTIDFINSRVLSPAIHKGSDIAAAGIFFTLLPRNCNSILFASFCLICSNTFLVRPDTNQLQEIFKIWDYSKQAYFRDESFRVGINKNSFFKDNKSQTLKSMKLYG